MAMLRSIGTFIENSSFDKCWIEANLYNGTTVKQILDCGDVKRELDSHIHVTTILSLTGFVLKSHSNDHQEDLQNAQ
jgi:hypothetical protein